jgi:hypothetical protein
MDSFRPGGDTPPRRDLAELLAFETGGVLDR